MHVVPATSVLLGIPASVQLSAVQGLPSSKTLVSSTTVERTPLASHRFCMQLPYCCDGGGPGV